MNEKEMLQKILYGMQEIQHDMKEMKHDVADLKQDVAVLKQDVASLKQRVTAIELHLENRTDHFLNILAENHISLVDQLNKTIPAADKSQLYEIRVDFLTEKVNKLEKEVTDIKTKIA